jgi:FkbM family methyltransferase
MYFLGEYEPSTTRLVQRLATPGWTVLDVGANAGYFSVIAALAGGDGSHVAAFEPNPQLARMLTASVALNPQVSIHVVPAAVGDHAGELPLHLTSVSRNSGLSSMRSDLPDTAGEAITVSVVTIDDFCARHNLAPDLIKIDVEGFEAQVLKGAARTLVETPPRAVICEIAPGRDDPERIIGFMRAHGYEAHAIEDDGSLRHLTLELTGVFENVCFTLFGERWGARHPGL